MARYTRHSGCAGARRRLTAPPLPARCRPAHHAGRGVAYLRISQLPDPELGFLKAEPVCWVEAHNGRARSVVVPAGSSGWAARRAARRQPDKQLQCGLVPWAEISVKICKP